MDTEEKTTVCTSYVFRGIEYVVTMSTTGGSSLSVEVEDRLTADQWRATFDSAYVEDLTHKTGNFKQFHIFVSMLESAVTQSSDSVSLDLLTYSDLESLRQRKTGNTAKTSIPSSRSVSVNSKRYLILTYTVEFDRIHYPLPLPYMGKPDPRALQETIRQLRSELKSVRTQGTSDFKSKEFEKLQRDYKLLLKEKEEIEAEFLQYRREMKSSANGNAVKELRMLKSVVKNLEEELMKEKTRHQRSASKRGQEYRDLLEEVEELRASERNLRVRVKSLTNELGVYKRDQIHSIRKPRAPARNRFSSRERSDSRERSVSRDRSWSSDRFSARERSGSRDRSRPSSAPNGSRHSDKSHSFRNSYSKPRSRTPSPSPAGARTPRFDPTAYIKDKERRKKESEMKKQRRINSNLSGCSNRSGHSQGSRNGSKLSARNRSRNFSAGSGAEFSDGGFSDSSYNSRRSYRSYSKNRQPLRSRAPLDSCPSSPDVPTKAQSRTSKPRMINKLPVSSTPDHKYHTKRRRPLRNKENLPVPSAGEDSDYFDRSAEISEIDERLTRLQQLMKTSMDG